MNIFYLHKKPRECARMHCDKHVVKMILETAQILCTCHWINNSKAPYKPTHKKHPCVLWANKSLKNYKWLCKLGIELCKEYTHRYGKVHKSQKIIEWCSVNIPNIPNNKFSEPFQAMPEKYRKKESIKAYRKYYNEEKLKFAKWTKRKKPVWIKKYSKPL
jgi:hypothetical protein